jgi:hypothetical protein
MEQAIETGEMLTIGEHGKHSEGKSHAAANWADKKAKRDSEPRVGCHMVEEDIESEEDSENELSKEYRQIQRHSVPKTKNGLEDITPCGKSGIRLIDAGRGTNTRRLCMLRSIRLATSEIMGKSPRPGLRGRDDDTTVNSGDRTGDEPRLYGIIRPKRPRYIVCLKEMISSRAI